MKLKSYIYGIRQVGGEVFYVGSSKYEPSHRFEAHVGLLRNGNHYNTHFQNKVNKIGVDSLECITLEIVPRHKQFIIEVDWINKLKASNKLVNKTNNELYEYSQYSVDTITDEQIRKIVKRGREFLDNPPELRIAPCFDFIKDKLALLYEKQLEAMCAINDELVRRGYG